MGLFRNRGDDDSTRRKYQMRQKLMSIGDDYWIEDDAGDKAFKVDGKAMRMRDTWVLEDDPGVGRDGFREGDTALHDIVGTTMPGLRYGSEWTSQQQQQQQQQG